MRASLHAAWCHLVSVPVSTSICHHTGHLAPQLFKQMVRKQSQVWEIVKPRENMALRVGSGGPGIQAWLAYQLWCDCRKIVYPPWASEILCMRTATTNREHPSCTCWNGREQDSGKGTGESSLFEFLVEARVCLCLRPWGVPACVVFQTFVCANSC